MLLSIERLNLMQLRLVLFTFSNLYCRPINSLSPFKIKHPAESISNCPWLRPAVHTWTPVRINYVFSELSWITTVLHVFSRYTHARTHVMLMCMRTNAGATTRGHEVLVLVGSLTEGDFTFGIKVHDTLYFLFTKMLSGPSRPPQELRYPIITSF